MTKWIVFAVLAATYYLVNATVVNVAPEITGELALEQFANPSVATDTALRVWNNNTLLNGFYWAVTILGLVNAGIDINHLFKQGVKEKNEESNATDCGGCCSK